MRDIITGVLALIVVVLLVYILYFHDRTDYKTRYDDIKAKNEELIKLNEVRQRTIDSLHIINIRQDSVIALREIRITELLAQPPKIKIVYGKIKDNIRRSTNVAEIDSVIRAGARLNP
jgi:hypothetical protein